MNNKIKVGTILVLDELEVKHSGDLDYDFDIGRPFGTLVNTGRLKYYEVKEIRK